MRNLLGRVKFAGFKRLCTKKIEAKQRQPRGKTHVGRYCYSLSDPRQKMKEKDAGEVHGLPIEWPLALNKDR